VHGLDESLRGDFAQDRFRLATRTRADSVSLQFAGIPWLSRVALALDAEVDADLPAHRFTFRRDTLRLNQLLLAFEGAVATGGPDLALDLTFAAPGTAFKDILSLVPAIYAHDFAELQASGTMAVSGRVSGTLGERAFPALALRAQVRDGAFRYPTLPMGARDVAMELAVDNPGGHRDSTVIALRRFHAAIGGNPVDARLTVRTPVSDPDVDLALAGVVELGDLARTITIEGMRELRGRVAANLAVRARRSDVDARRADRVSGNGSLDASRVVVRSAALPRALAIDTAAVRFTAGTQRLATLVARYGASDARATGSLDNLVGFALLGQALRGTASVSSRFVDLDELVPTDSTTEVVPVPARVDLALDATAERVKFGKLVATGVRGGLHVKDQRVTLDELRLAMLGGGVVASGWYETVDLARPAFDVALRLDSVDVPTAFSTVVTVQRLAPVARWAKGTVSGTTRLRGILGADMMPRFDLLSGDGTVASEGLALEGVPLFGRLADAVKVEALRNPALRAMRATFAVADGRLTVKPFTVDAAGAGLTIGGSHGFDQTLRYDLGLALPRALLGNAANDAVARLAARAGASGAAVAQAPTVQLRAQVTGTVTDPRVAVDFAGVAASVREAVKDAVQEQVATQAAAARQLVDSAAEAARARARAEAERLVVEAERQAESVRGEARAIADRVRQEANARADSLLARATNPLAKRAAQAGTDRIRKEADQQAERIVREADARADALVAQARQRAEALVPAVPAASPEAPAP
jgi:hypothetical protein